MKGSLCAFCLLFSKEAGGGCTPSRRPLLPPLHTALAWPAPCWPPAPCPPPFMGRPGSPPCPLQAPCGSGSTAQGLMGQLELVAVRLVLVFGL